MLKVTALEYHDVINVGEPTASGFSIPGADSYKIELPRFQSHLEEIKKSGVRIGSCFEIMETEALILLTFDDGGISAHSPIAPLLESYGWRGHFFVATGQIGADRFLSAEQIRELDAKGHVIGAHSVTHPLQMGALSDRELSTEWGDSVATLSDILGRPVVTASIPGGQYSTRIAEAAARCGVQYLFTSEPVSAVETIAGARVIGRYILRGGSSARFVARLTARHTPTIAREWLTWNAKKAAKALCGPLYGRLRELVLD